ncbi:MAG: ferritin-like domain-containing protein, partial [Myxococcales bacterium]|nr:ferritin-like domain-containing protein [Myxococcales bacterium]
GSIWSRRSPAGHLFRALAVEDGEGQSADTMLLSREEMTFDFGGARFDPQQDREILRWILSQFLYGEVTGIQVGHWIYDAPNLEAARFLARQALEEFQHVGNFLRILQMLDLEPLGPHPVIRFLATGMMGGDWAEHVTTEMALGEGFVLMAMYALMDTLDHEEAVAILTRAARQEASHIDFGEAETMRLIAQRPHLRRKLLGLSLVWVWGVRRLSDYMERKLPAEHPVLCQLPAFVAHALKCTSLRIERMGLSDVPLSAISRTRQTALVAEAYGSKALVGGVGRLRPFQRKARLTDTYLSDPLVRATLAGQPVK